MNRIYLQARKSVDDSYWIKDRLDNKKLGELKVIEQDITCQIKPEFSSQHLDTEALLTFNQADSAWQQYWLSYVKNYNQQFNGLSNYQLPLFSQSCRLIQCEDDMFQRPAFLHPACHQAWIKIKHQADSDGIDLQIISAYRSLAYQKQLIENKLKKGLSIKDILTVNTLPGYSEHHTGCAIDIGSPDAAILEVEFEQSAAFVWLCNNADQFGFHMSYPKGNTTGICYEPWHWCYQLKKPL
jgi:D-alanyl-D-alanine carboxypeptidase